MSEDLQKATTQGKIKIFEEKVQALMQMGGEKQVKKQHDGGKLTARERLDHLFDKGTFQEVQLFVKHHATLFGMDKKEIPADGVITGFGKVNGRVVFAASQDFTSAGGTLGEMHAKKIWKVMDMAIAAQKPFIAINDSGGARIQEGVPSLEGYGGIFYRNTHSIRLHSSGYRHYGADRGWRGLFAGSYRLDFHGKKHILYVHHRAGGH